MSQKLFSTVLIVVVAIFIASCSSGVIGAQDTGDIDRTQPDKVESVWDTPSDPDQTDLQSDEWYYRQTNSVNTTNYTTMAERPFRYYSLVELQGVRTSSLER